MSSVLSICSLADVRDFEDSWKARRSWRGGDLGHGVLCAQWFRWVSGLLEKDSARRCANCWKNGRAIVLEWNTADAAGQQGTAAAWDVHIRLGGFVGSGIQFANCEWQGSASSAIIMPLTRPILQGAKLSGHPIDPCIAAFIGLHITSQVSKLRSGPLSSQEYG